MDLKSRIFITVGHRPAVAGFAGAKRKVKGRRKEGETKLPQVEGARFTLLSASAKGLKRLVEGGT
jgi:hypothetical protein